MSNVGSVRCSCYLIFSNVLESVLFCQVCSYPKEAEMRKNFRNLAKLGQLFLILAACMVTEKTNNSFGEKTEDPKVMKFLQLFGRLLLVVMFIYHIGNDSLEVSPRFRQ